MDRDFVEKVTKVVIEVVKDLNDNKISLNQSAVKIWKHESPLPDPIVQSSADAIQLGNKQKMIQITPYVKE